LAFDAYSHFTSPIRRYPDLLVHRVIKAILAKSRYQLPVLPIPGEAHAKLARRLEKSMALKAADPSHKPKKISPENQAWQAAGMHCSANERRADEASRDVEAWLKCKYMREHLGEEYGGVVSAVTSFGIFVTLDAMYVEGLVHITELGGEYYRFDEARQELRGERTGMRYAIGSRVRVQVSRVDLDGRRIDFRLVHEGDGLNVKPVKDKSVFRDAALLGASDNLNVDLPTKRRGARIAKPLPRGAKSKAIATKPGKGVASPKTSRKAKR
jgi:ribonuclease R